MGAVGPFTEDGHAIVIRAPLRPIGSLTFPLYCVPGSSDSTRSAAPRNFGGDGISKSSRPAALNTT